MCNYYEKRDAKVKIANLLMLKGWQVYGYTPDNSDPMTDYYSPAYWEGIATHGKYIFVCDNKNMSGYQTILNQSEYNEFKSKKYKQENNILSAKDTEKVEKLKRLAENYASSEGEKMNALAMIERLKNKNMSNFEKIETVELLKEVINFPKTNYMWFIWDIESQCILEKSLDLTSLNCDKYNHYTDIENNTLIKLEGNKLFRRSWGQDYTEQEKQEILIEQDRIFNILNDFLNSIDIDNLNNKKQGYQYLNTNKGESFIYHDVLINSIDELNENIFIQYSNSVYRFTPYTGKVTYNKEKIYEFEKIKKDGTLYLTRGGRKDIIKVTNDYIKGHYKDKFKTQEKTTAFKWSLVKRVNIFTLENKQEIKKEVKEITEIKQLEIQEKTNYKINFNLELNGVEIIFNNKPTREILDNLKNIGFKWNPKKILWYAKNNIETLEKLKTVLN